MKPRTMTPPPLQAGDRLSRDEFERRYDAMPNLKKAELIEGEVFMPSPVRANLHGNPHGKLVTWLGTYEGSTPGVVLGDNVSLRLKSNNELQPDGVLYIDPQCGGQVTISEDDYIVGGPELVAEVSASSVGIDLNRKKQVYRRNHVLEYLVWRVQDDAIDWLILREGKYQRLEAGDGICRSNVLPGLWLDVAAMMRRDTLQFLKALQQGLGTSEHAAFVARLAQTKEKLNSPHMGT